MRLFRSLTFCLLLMAGCGPAVPREDLGTVLDEVPKIPGVGQPDELPELDPPTIPEPGSAEPVASP